MIEITRDSPIEIALAVYDPKGTYSVHAGVVMTSIFEHTKAPVRVHILHNETLTDDNKTKFLRTAEKYSQSVEFHDLTERIKNLGPKALAIASKVPAWSIGSLFRILIADVITTSRVIYLDCDILVNLDICKLWEIKLQGNCIAGAWDHPEYRRKRRINFSSEALKFVLLGCRLCDYINSGVLLMDLDKIRELPKSMTEVAPTWFVRHANLVNFPDQDFLNVFFRGSILHIPDMFNQREQKYDEEEVILHTIIRKPWDGVEALPQDFIYWQMFLKSAWGEGVSQDELVKILINTASHNPDLHRHTSQCWNHIWTRLRRDFWHTFGIFKVLIKEAWYWLTLPFKKTGLDK